MAGAAGGFVTRSFESMLKECAANKKYAPLQKAIQTCLDNMKETNQVPQADEKDQTGASAADQRVDSDEAVKGEYTEGGLQPGSATEEGTAIPKPVENCEPITSALACAGRIFSLLSSYLTCNSIAAELWKSNCAVTNTLPYFLGNLNMGSLFFSIVGLLNGWATTDAQL
ncbi:uncharacterized protein LOC109714845 [Ananas comosus]|uniref:Uncharacterized protein LOC109714845 n=1 Tax=Ananas comosus TaxID=4615 RepID=A0A6P5FHS0_ANACO|nr:uncharacterized protein LOC109714845 [Ananas comosus]